MINGPMNLIIENARKLSSERSNGNVHALKVNEAIRPEISAFLVEGGGTVSHPET